MPIFYVYLHSKVEGKTDTALKVVAASSVAAKKMAARRNVRERFTVGSVYRPKDFKVVHPDWYELLYKQAAETALDG